MTDKETADIEAGATRPTNFIRQIIENDLEQGNNLPRYWCGHPAPYSEQLWRPITKVSATCALTTPIR